MRVLVFGDSIAQGFWDTEGGWVARLRKYYDKRQLLDLMNSDEPTVFNLGISGDITKGVLQRFNNELSARRWRWPGETYCFIFAIGINDTVIENDHERSNTNQYEKEIKNLINLAKIESDKILFLGLTPVDESTANGRPGKPKKYSNERIIVFDNSLEKVCSQSGVKYLKIFNTIQSSMDTNQLFDDGLHPNDAGHQLIFELVQPVLDKVIQS